MTLMSSLFDWLDYNPTTYWIISVPATLLMFARVCRVIWLDANDRPQNPQRAAWLDAVILILFLLAWRWPFLLCAADYNPDESQFIAGAITLKHDPVFWRSVDGTTSGPLNFYVLLPLHFIGVPLDYFNARLTGLLLVWGTLTSTLLAISAFARRGVAWLAVLPFAGFYATVYIPDFVHYSSEHLPLFMIALSCWLLATRAEADRVRLLLACLIAGASPWAKLQVAPMGTVLVAWALWQVLSQTNHNRKWPLGITVATIAALPTLLILGLTLMFGVTRFAVERYILQNVFYVEEGRSIAEALRMMWKLSLEDGRFPLLMGTVFAGIVGLGAFAGLRRSRLSLGTVVYLVLLVAAVVAVVTPRREFLHYVLFLVVPLALVIGALADACWRSQNSRNGRLILAGTLLITTALPPFATRVFQPVPEMFGEFLEHWRRPRTPTAEVIRVLSGGEGSLAIWGWRQGLYVESDLPQGTRDSISIRSMRAGPLQDQFRREYLADFTRNRPRVFVDVSGPFAFLFTDRAEHGYETFPELAREVRENYLLAHDTPDARVYVRNDPEVARTVTALDINAAEARGRNPGSVPPPDIFSMPLDWRTLGRRRVLMLLPPSAVEWELAENVRQVSVVFGIDPIAYQHGHTNGVEIVIDVVEGDIARLVYTRTLNPRVHRHDRGRQVALLTLPPFSSDARLRVRSGAGEHGDSAWDWLYLDQISMRTHPEFLPQQFPNFNRVPFAAIAPRSVIQVEGASRSMDIHVPARFDFALRGDERRVRFEFGMLSGCYDEPGKSDGAAFRVEIARNGEPTRTVFDRYLEPAINERDRGEQRADIRLDGVLAGDVLTMTLDPGPKGDAAWDWTFLRDVKIE